MKNQDIQTGITIVALIISVVNGNCTFWLVTNVR